MKTQGSTKQTTEMVVTAIRLTQEEHAWITAYAAAQQRSVGGQIRFLIARLRAELDAEGTAAA